MTRIKYFEVVVIETNVIYNKDCIKGMKQKIPNNSIDCVFIDVPYKIKQGGVATTVKGYGGKNKWKNDKEKLELIKKGKIFKHNDIDPNEYLPEIYRVMKEKSHIYLMTNSTNLSKMEIAMKEVGFNINNILVMIKNNAVTNQWYMKNCEFVIFARKGKAKPINNHSIKSAVHVEMPSHNKKIHDTQKPVSYVRKLIKNSTSKGNIVLDCFMGSGTTAIACITSKRKYIGFEISEKEYNKCLKRLSKYDKKCYENLPEEKRPKQKQLF